MENLINGLKTNRSFAVSSLLVLALLALAAAAPVLSPYDPVEATMQNAYLEPSAEHIFGTDKLGRDVFSRILYGARYSLSGVLLLVAVIFLVGTSLGIISGYYGGKVDTVIMRISDMMISFPGMILAIAIAGILGGSLVNAVIALTIVSWTKYARLARSMVLKIKKRDFVEAAVVNGGKPTHILWKHIVPNILPLMVITAAADIGAMMMELAGLWILLSLISKIIFLQRKIKKAFRYAEVHRGQRRSGRHLPGNIHQSHTRHRRRPLHRQRPLSQKM